MVTVNFEGNTYLFSKSDTRGIWIGFGGPKYGRYPGLYCAAPAILYPEMTALAIEQGADRAELIIEKKEKKASKPRSAKLKKNAISIF